MRQDAVATRARLIAVAERLFAEQGIDGVSLNEIVRSAGQRNNSALQYHFGDKVGLIEAILDKHSPAIEQQRHALLDELEGVATPPLRRVVEALVLPIVAKLDDRDGGLAYIRVSAQLIGHPAFPLITFFRRRPNRAVDRLTRLLMRSLPEVPLPLIAPRMQLLAGILFHAIADWARLAEHDATSVAPRDLFVCHLIDSLLAVLAARASPETRRCLTAHARH